MLHQRRGNMFVFCQSKQDIVWLLTHYQFILHLRYCLKVLGEKYIYIYYI